MSTSPSGWRRSARPGYVSAVGWRRWLEGIWPTRQPHRRRTPTCTAPTAPPSGSPRSTSALRPTRTTPSPPARPASGRDGPSRAATSLWAGSSRSPANAASDQPRVLVCRRDRQAEADRGGVAAGGDQPGVGAGEVDPPRAPLAPAPVVGAPPAGGGVTALGSWEGARGLAEDVRWYGRWMREEAERRLGHLYPRVVLPAEHGGGQATVIAWIWARTVTSPNPAWDGPMPLVRSFSLSTKKGKETWVQPVVDREHRRSRFEIRTGPGCPAGTVGRTGAVCLATGTPAPLRYVRAEGKAGRMGVQLMAIVAEGPRGRVYLPPDPEHERVAALFTPRQLLALRAFSDLVGEARERLRADAPDAGAYGVAVATYLAFAVDKLADRNSTICAWEPRMDRLRGTFQGQAPGTADQTDAASLDTTRPVLIATDPPYYDNVGYADLSDFFYVWLRRSLRDLYPALFGTLLAPKSAELVATPYRFGGRERAGAHFEQGFLRAFTRMRATQAAAGPLTLFYAFKQAEDGGADDAAVVSTGWETMLEGLLRSGFAVTGTWPMRTELPSRMLSSGTNALASSIVLVCRPRCGGSSRATSRRSTSRRRPSGRGWACSPATTRWWRPTGRR